MKSSKRIISFILALVIMMGTVVMPSPSYAYANDEINDRFVEAEYHVTEENGRLYKEYNYNDVKPKIKTRFSLFMVGDPLPYSINVIWTTFDLIPGDVGADIKFSIYDSVSRKIIAETDKITESTNDFESKYIFKETAAYSDSDVSHDTSKWRLRVPNEFRFDVRVKNADTGFSTNSEMEAIVAQYATPIYKAEYFTSKNIPEIEIYKRDTDDIVKEVTTNPTNLGENEFYSFGTKENGSRFYYAGKQISISHFEMQDNLVKLEISEPVVANRVQLYAKGPGATEYNRQGSFTDTANGNIPYHYVVTGDYKTPHIVTVRQDLKVNFNPNGGHWETAETGQETNPKSFVIGHSMKIGDSWGGIEAINVPTSDEIKPPVINGRNNDFLGWNTDENATVALSSEDIANIEVTKDTTLYAIYELQALGSAKIEYLDLGGKPIDPKYEIEEENYPDKKEGNIGDSIDLTDFNTPKFVGYEYQNTVINPTKGTYTKEGTNSIQLYYKKLNDVIPSKEISGRPAGYVTVNFDLDSKGTTTDETIYYVNPKVEGLTGVVAPTVKANIGYKFTGWDSAIKTAYTTDTTHKALYNTIDDVIEVSDPENTPEIPDGYVTVEFLPGEGGTLDGTTKFYVNPTKEVDLTNYQPTVNVNSSLIEYKGWDKSLQAKFETDTEITAVYYGTIGPVEGATVTPSTQTIAEGAAINEITISPKTNVATITVVNPPEGLTYSETDKTISGTPVINDWKTGEKTRDIKVAITVTNPDGSKTTENATITVTRAKDVVPQKPGEEKPTVPESYVKVEFVDGEHGTIDKDQTKIYWVNPEKQVSLNAPVVTPNTDFMHTGWTYTLTFDDDNSIVKNTTETKTVKDNFKVDTIVTATYIKTTCMTKEALNAQFEKAANEQFENFGDKEDVFVSSFNENNKTVTVYVMDKDKSMELLARKLGPILLELYDNNNLIKYQYNKFDITDLHVIFEQLTGPHMTKLDSIRNSLYDKIKKTYKVDDSSEAKLGQAIGDTINLKLTVKEPDCDNEINVTYKIEIKEAISSLLKDKVEAKDIAVWVGDTIPWDESVVISDFAGLSEENQAKVKAEFPTFDQEGKKTVGKAKFEDASTPSRNSETEQKDGAEGSIKITFSDGSYTTVNEHMLYVYDKISDYPTEGKPVPKDGIKVTFKIGNGIKSFVDNTTDDKYKLVKANVTLADADFPEVTKKDQNYGDVTWTGNATNQGHVVTDNNNIFTATANKTTCMTPDALKAQFEEAANKKFENVGSMKDVFVGKYDAKNHKVTVAIMDKEKSFTSLSGTGLVAGLTDLFENNSLVKFKIANEDERDLNAIWDASGKDKKKFQQNVAQIVGMDMANALGLASISNLSDFVDKEVSLILTVQEPDCDHASSITYTVEGKEAVSSLLKDKLQGKDIAVWVGDNINWKDGVALAGNPTEQDKANFAKITKVEDTTETQRTSETAGKYEGKLLVTFDDGSYLTLDPQDLYVRANEEVITVDNKDWPKPIDGIEVTFKKGEGIASFNPENMEVLVKLGVEITQFPTVTKKTGYDEPVNWTGTKNEGLIVSKTNNVFTAYATGKTTTFKVTKVWPADVDEIPAVKFVLWRSYETDGATEATEEPVSGVDAKIITKGTTEAEWTNLPTATTDGKVYTYYVVEEFVEENAKNGNWILGDMVTDENGNTITNSLKTKPGEGATPDPDKNLMGELTIKKVLDTKPVEKDQISALAVSEPLEFEFKITGPYDYNETFTLKAGEEKTFENLYYGEYTVKEEGNFGYTPTYEPEDKVTLKNTDGQREATITVTNKNVINPNNPNLLSLTIEKVWENIAADKTPSVTIELHRTNGLEEGSNDAIDEKVGEFVVPAGATGDALKKTFENLPKHDGKGNEFVYSAVEVINDEIISNYIVSTTETKDGFVVTNTFVDNPIEKINISATKTWKNLPEGAKEPEVKFELWRKVGETGPEEMVVEGLVVNDGKVNFGPQDKTNANKEVYTYFVKESYTNKAEKDNWTTTQIATTGTDGTISINVTNTLKDETEVNGKIKITKVLENVVPGETIMPLNMNLFAVNEPLTFKVKISGDYISKEIDIKAGQTITVDGLYYGDYIVEETVSQGYTPSYSAKKVFLTSENSEASVTITNKNIISNDPGNPTGRTVDITVKKVWAEITGSKPQTTIELWRKGIDLNNQPFQQHVKDWSTTEDYPGTEETETFTGLTKDNPSGREFVYYVKETGETNGQVTIGDNTYAVTYDQDNFTITNTYQKPEPGKVDITATKTWVNGPSTDHKKVTLKLYRRVGETPGQEVTDLNPEIYKDAEDDSKFIYKWTGLDKEDNSNTKYTYYVEEDGVTNEEVTLANGNKYQVTYDETKLNVTNTYVVPKTEEDIIAKKIWAGVPDDVAKPEVYFQLYRKTTTGVEIAVENAKLKVEETVDASGEVLVNFGKQDKTDINGNAYEYFVKEVNSQGEDFVPENFNKEEEGLVITNTYIKPTEEVTVTFDSNKGTPVAPITIQKGQTITEPETPTREGWTFAGWYLDGEKYDFTKSVTEDITLKARWSIDWTPIDPIEYVTVTFDSNKGTPVAPITVQKGNTVTEPTTPTREGWTFEGWYLDGKKYDFTQPVTEDITLKALWSTDLTPIEPIEYVTVTFDSNKGTPVAPITVQKGNTVTEPTTPTREGWTFEGWYLDGEKYDFNTQVTKDITLKARWSTKWTPIEPIEHVIVTFDSNGGSNVDPITIQKGQRVTKPTNPTKVDPVYGEMTFERWELDGEEYDFSQPVNANITLKAVWSIDGEVIEPIEMVTVSFDSNKGTPVAPITIQKGQAITEPTAPTREGWRFEGWYLHGKKYDFTQPVNEDITVKALWSTDLTPIEPIEYVTVSFDSNKGTPVAPITVQKGNTVTEPTTPTREGWAFEGWYLDGEKYDFIQPVTEDITLKALWSTDLTPIEPIEEVTITFEPGDNGIGEMKPFTLNKGTIYTLPENGFTPVEGYIFAGWEIEENIYQPGETITVTTDIVARAMWKQIIIPPVDPDIIGPVDPDLVPNPDANKYWTIRFISEDVDEGIVAVKNTFYILKTAKVELADLQVPQTYPANGYRFDRWEPKLENIFIEKDMTIIAIFEKIDIPNPEQKPEIPFDPWEIIFGPGENISTKPQVPAEKTHIHEAYIKGYPNRTFGPDLNITRAEAATIISRLKGFSLGDNSRPNFVDVKSAWYNSAINAVVKNGIMNGYPDGTFKPNEKITRAEFAQMIKNLDKINSATAPFADIKGHWAEGAIDEAYGNGRINGYPDGSFRPDSPITRAEAVKIVNSLFERTVDSYGLTSRLDNPNMLVKFSDVDPSHWAYYEIMEAANDHEYVRRENGKVVEDWLEIE